MYNIMTTAQYRQAMNLVIELEQVTKLGTNERLDKLTKELRIELTYALRQTKK